MVFSTSIYTDGPGTTRRSRPVERIVAGYLAATLGVILVFVLVLILVPKVARRSPRRFIWA